MASLKQLTKNVRETIAARNALWQSPNIEDPKNIRHAEIAAQEAREQLQARIWKLTGEPAYMFKEVI